MTNSELKQSPEREKTNEDSARASIWTHPYTLYIILTIVLFALLVLAGWIASVNDWIPNRRVDG